jgi:class 3 adenylate cyclase
MDGPDRPDAGPAADELRPVTALFADIVGSTGLGERLSPAEVKALVGECVTRMSRVVEEFGGTVQAYQGDGICAYFGVPAAHEDDADRAAEAGLALVTAVEAYGRDVRQAWGIEEFDVRVGINGGLAAVGRVGAAWQQTVALGDMTNVAARLQAAAAPGTVVAGERTAQRLMPRFVLEPIGELALKGRDTAVPAWRVLRRKPPGGDRAQAPLVGRELEAARLRRAADDLVAGRGQSLLVIGEAGIGKSRLLAELHDSLGAQVTWLEGDCRSYGAVGPYRPFVDMLRTWLGVEQSAREIVVRTRLRARMSALYGDDAADALLFLGHLLSVQPDRDGLERLRDRTAHELMAETRSAFCGWIERLADAQPLVVAIEGFHEADDTTCQMLEDLLELTDRAPVMLVLSARPERDTPAWAFRAHAMTQFGHRFEELALEPIDADAAGQLLDITAPGMLDPHTREELVHRAEGNPLYLEEMAHALEADGIRPRAWTVTVGATPLPPSLDALLVARIDRLDADARALGQTAAVIGREFPARVLEHVVGATRFGSGLPGLLRSGVIREVRRYPELEYSFRHGLLQEAARSTLTPARRADLCARLAEAFEQLFADSLDERLEMLAHYHAQSGNLARALGYLERAGERAAQWGQPEEAARLWTRAVRVAEAMDDADAAARLRRRLGAPEPDPDTSDRSGGPTEQTVQVGPYALDPGKLAAGTVARALTEDGEAVAVRLIGRSGDDRTEDWERFRAAAFAAGRADVRYLLPVRAEEADGWRLAVMPWCDGGSLADRLAGDSRPSPPETISMAVRVALGLDALHREGLVHGAVRPQSIMLDGTGGARLVPVAMPPYDRDFPGRAPEVLAGGDPTPASDIYELAAIVGGCLDAARGSAGGASDQLRWAIDRSRARDPGRRPNSAAMLARMLRAAADVPTAE